jgi:hypothetical protein
VTLWVVPGTTRHDIHERPAVDGGSFVVVG